MIEERRTKGGKVGRDEKGHADHAPDPVHTLTRGPGSKRSGAEVSSQAILNVGKTGLTEDEQSDRRDDGGHERRLEALLVDGPPDLGAVRVHHEVLVAHIEECADDSADGDAQI